MTSSLRKCFDHNQNIMLTIILLAFSMIGLVGLIIGNRFILIIFSASMTLILIASITIYAIGRTEQDSRKPKVPYYLNLPAESSSNENKRPAEQATRSNPATGNKWLAGHQTDLKARKLKFNRTRIAHDPRTLGSRTLSKKSLYSNQVHQLQDSVEDYADESESLIKNFNLQSARLLINARSLAAFKDKTNKSNLPAIEVTTDELEKDSPKVAKKLAPQRDKDLDLDSDDTPKVENEQWVTYERYLYEKYLNILSLSIDLVLQSILAAWMALLLDEDSDQCFGSKSSQKNRKKAHKAKEPPVYNYKGVRYSIRPETQESSTRIVVG